MDMQIRREREGGGGGGRERESGEGVSEWGREGGRGRVREGKDSSTPSPLFSYFFRP